MMNDLFDLAPDQLMSESGLVDENPSPRPDALHATELAPARIVDLAIGVVDNYDEGKAPPGHKVGGFFLHLAALAREDERLRDLMGRYSIEIRCGTKVLWPPQKEEE